MQKLNITALLLATALASLAVAAPAPPPRPAPAITSQALSGTWTMTWGTCVWPATLTATGGYGSGTGTSWTGWWHYDAASQTLTISERAIAGNGTLDTAGSPYVWYVRALRRDGKGGFVGDLHAGTSSTGVFRLDRVRGVRSVSGVNGVPYRRMPVR